jgi:hypothetical protein
MLPRVRGAHGELPEPGSSRWGKRVFLHTNTIDGKAPRTAITVIATDAQPIITPMVVSLRFSSDGQTFTPAVPSAFGGTIRVELVEMIDVKTGPFREQFELEADDAQPFCGVVCLALQVSVTLLGENQQIWVQALAAPTTTIDCADIVPPTPTPTETTIRPFPTAGATRVPALTAPTTLILSNPLRAYFSIVNQSAVNLYVLLGDGVDITPGDELATIVIPPGVFGGYEVLNYTGPVSFKFDGDDGAGYALFTQGEYPP